MQHTDFGTCLVQGARGAVPNLQSSYVTAPIQSMDHGTLEGSPRDAARARVFISYIQESAAHKEWVLALADRLRKEGIDAWVDLYVPSPSMGWPRWVEDQLAKADFILLVCTPLYSQNYLEPSTGARRNHWEGLHIRQRLHDADGHFDKFVPVQLDNQPSQIPAPLSGVTAYSLPSQYEQLYRRLTNQKEFPAPHLGELKSLPSVPPMPRVSEGAPETLDWSMWLRLTFRVLVRLLWQHPIAALSTVGLVLLTLVLWNSGWLRASKEGVALGPPTKLERCIQKARDLNRPYVIESATNIWHISDRPGTTKTPDTPETPSSRSLSLRSIYTIRAIESFGPKDKLFEDWSGYDNAHFLHWHAPDPISARSNDAQRYFVEVGADRGEQRTIITGAEYDYSLPRKDNRAGCNNTTTLQGREEALRYPNDIDVICELTIVIESNTTPLHSLGGALVRESYPHRRDPIHRTEGSVRQHSLSLHLDEILVPGDDVCLKYSW